jgi:hypothetical protein
MAAALTDRDRTNSNIWGTARRSRADARIGAREKRVELQRSEDWQVVR